MKAQTWKNIGKTLTCFLILLVVIGYSSMAMASTLKLPEALIRIENNAFEGIHVDYVEFPSGIQYIAENAFSNASFVGKGNSEYAKNWCTRHNITWASGPSSGNEEEENKPVVTYNKNNAVLENGETIVVLFGSLAIDVCMPEAWTLSVNGASWLIPDTTQGSAGETKTVNFSMRRYDTVSQWATVTIATPSMLFSFGVLEYDTVNGSAEYYALEYQDPEGAWRSVLNGQNVLLNNRNAGDVIHFRTLRANVPLKITLQDTNTPYLYPEAFPISIPRYQSGSFDLQLKSVPAKGQEETIRFEVNNQKTLQYMQSEEYLYKKSLLGDSYVVNPVMGSFSITLAAEEEYYSEAKVTARMNELYELLGGPGYFTVNQASCTTTYESNHSCSNCYSPNVLNANWFKSIFGNVSYTSFPVSSGYTQAGWSCLGFSHFAAYYIFRDPDHPNAEVTASKIGTYSFNEANAKAYAQTGDLIRFDSSHSAICYYSDSNGMYVLDCNYGVNRTQCRVDKHYILYSKYSNFTINRCDNAE